MSNLNGAMVHRRGETIFIRLPESLWRSAGKCNCPVCNGREGFWDTLAVEANSASSNRYDYAWTVHYPKFACHESPNVKGVQS